MRAFGYKIIADLDMQEDSSIIKDSAILRLSRNLDPAYLLDCARKKMFLSFSKSIASNLCKKLTSLQIEPKPILNPLKSQRLNSSTSNTKINWKSSAKNNKFNLHSFNFIFSEKTAGDGLGLIQDWMAKVPAGDKYAWHAEPLSRRIPNWLAYLSRKMLTEAYELDKDILVSVKTQLEFLKLLIEKDLASKNDLYIAESLIVGGAFLQDQQALALGQSILENILPKIILADGGHVERSPLLQCQVLEVLVSCSLATRSAQTKASDLIKDYIQSMSLFLNAVLDEDRVPLINSCPVSLAPKTLLAFIVEHNFISVETAACLTLDRPFTYLKDSELILSRTSNIAFTFDLAEPSRHIGTLSMLLSLNAQEILTDSGSDDSLQDYFSSARAHNILSISSQQSTGQTKDISFDPEAKIASASWQQTTDSLIKRSVQLVPGGLVWIDSVDASEGHNFESNLHFAPGLSISEDIRCGNFRAFKVMRESQQLATLLTEVSCQLQIVKSPYADGRGPLVERMCLREEGKLSQNFIRRFALIENRVSWDIEWMFERLTLD